MSFPVRARSVRPSLLTLTLLLYLLIALPQAAFASTGGIDCAAPISVGGNGGGGSGAGDSYVSNGRGQLLRWNNGDLFIYEENRRGQLRLVGHVPYEPPTVVCGSVACNGGDSHTEPVAEVAVPAAPAPVIQPVIVEVVNEETGEVEEKEELAYVDPDTGEVLDLVEEPPCIPAYTLPTATVSYSPDFPQIGTAATEDADPISVTITVTPGYDYVCGTGPDSVARVEDPCFSLAVESREWIEKELIKKYPNSVVQGNYPFCPDYDYSGGGNGLIINFDYDPKDPGFHELEIICIGVSAGPKREVIPIRTYFVESAITG